MAKTVMEAPMSGKKPTLTGESYIYINNEPILLAELSPKLQQEAATKIKLMLLEKTFTDKAKFYVEASENFSDD